MVEPPSCKYNRQGCFLDGLIAYLGPLQHLAHEVYRLLNLILFLYYDWPDLSLRSRDKGEYLALAYKRQVGWPSTPSS